MLLACVYKKTCYSEKGSEIGAIISQCRLFYFHNSQACLSAVRQENINSHPRALMQHQCNIGLGLNGGVSNSRLVAQRPRCD